MGATSLPPCDEVGAGLAKLRKFIVPAGALAGGFGYFYGGLLAGALRDLAGVILRFLKWDMDGVVPHAMRGDGRYRPGAEELQVRRDQMEREPQE
jgi:hypothetical protein